MQYTLTSLPFLSPKRRDALNLTPQRYKGWGWGLYHFTSRLIQILAGEAGEAGGARKMICINNFVKWY
jgi:hypothetical protein